MCPLVSAPNRGYADYQRVGNFDTGVLWDEDTGGVQNDFTSPVIDVSRYAYLGANIAALQGQPYIILQWYLDAGATVPAARREFFMTVSIAGNAQLRVPNLGPFLQITLSKVGPAAYRTMIQVYATNRSYPLEFIPREPVLIDMQSASIFASGTVVTYPSDYYAGPLQVWLDVAYSTGVLSLQWLTSAGVWDFLDQFNFTVSGNNRATFVTPTGAWRFQVSNSTGAPSTFYLTATPPTTGAT